MRTTVVGLGAVGGLLAARLLRSGAQVQALARGATLAAVRERGLHLRERPGQDPAAAWQTSAWPLQATDDIQELDQHPDLLIIALKAPALPALAPQLVALIGPNTLVLPAMNGVPWWFMPGAPLASVDPGGAIARALPRAQTLGCVVHLSCQAPEPGLVQHAFGQRLIVGDIDAASQAPPSSRVMAVQALLQQAGFEAEASGDVRRELWFKLWGNMTMNPVSALTGADAHAILDNDAIRAFMARAMDEAAAVGAHIGCPIAQTAEDRIAVTRQLGAFKTSMLQDVMAGRRIELDALVGAVREIAQRVGVATPHIDALDGLTRLMARTRGLL